MLDLVIKNGQIVTNGQTTTGWLAIAGAKIEAIGAGEAAPEARQTIDVKGNYVLPGIVDSEVHLPGGLQKGLAAETRAALAGGVTTWGLHLTSTQITNAPVEFPAPEDVKLYSQVMPDFVTIGNSSSLVDYFLTPCLMNPSHSGEILHLAEKWGITSYKSHLHLRIGPSAWSYFQPAKRMGYHGFDDGTVFLAMGNIARLGSPGIYCLHCENPEIIQVLQKRLIESGRKDTAAWSDRSPAFCEAGYVRTYAYYAKVTGCPIYIQHVTTPETVEELMKSRAEGVRVYGQTGHHYLTLTKEVWKCTIPLRDRERIDKCWLALRDGVIDCLGSDHVSAYRSREQMEVTGDVWATSGEFPRAEEMLPVMLSEGVNKGRISLTRLVELLCETPARIFGLYPQKGTLSAGSDADLVVVNLGKERTVGRDTVHSSAGWSIYDGWKLKGWPVMTIARGEVAMEWAEEEPRAKITAKSYGRYLARKLTTHL